MRRILLALLLVIAPLAKATTWYVTTGGSDSNPCTLASPCLTPAHAFNSVAAAGDTVNVAAGTYSNGAAQINLTNGGTTGNPITLTCATRGACTLSNSISGNNTVVEIDGNFVVFDGFIVTSTNVSIPNLNLGIYITGNNVSITHNTVHGIEPTCTSSGGGGINVATGAGSGDVIDSNLVYDIGFNNPSCQASGTVQVHGINFEPNNSSTVTITNNIIYHSSGGWGIQFQGGGQTTSSLIANNTIFSGTGGGVVLSASGGTLDHITLADNIVLDNGTSNAQCGFKETGTIGSSVAYQNNDAFGNNGGNYCVGGTPTGGISVDPSLGTTFINWQANGSGDYHELLGSPTIGAGINVSVTHDFAGGVRPTNSVYDMGAYQLQIPLSLTLSPEGFTILTDGASPVTFTPTCVYSGGAPTDSCQAAGGVTWSSPTRALNSSGGTVAGGVAKWSASYNPADNTIYNGAQTAVGVVHACAQTTVCDTALGQGDPTITISNIAISSNVVTLTVANSIPTVGAGQRVSFYGLTTVPAINGQFVTITTANTTTLTFPFTNANVSSTAETGHAVLPLNVYTTPSLGFYQNTQPGTFYTPTLGVGAKMQLGAGFTFTSTSPPNPFQWTCNWSSSNTAVATVDRYGSATGVSSGSVTFTCVQAGNGVIDNFASGTGLTYGPISVTNPTPTLQTWYVRPGGGTPYVNGTQTPAGQCDGKHDADYPGTGVNQPCAVGNLSYLWLDQVTPNFEQWMIGAGDTVIVRINALGYQINLTQLSPSYGGSAIVPINCGNADCFMPTIPSGTSAHHTKILGENYASCTSNAVKTLLYVSWAGKYAFNVQNSQFVDIACFNVTDQADCGYGGTFTPQCKNTALNYGVSGVFTTAMSSFDTFTDINIHGLGFEGFHGATGDSSFTLERVRIQVPFTGFDTDDDPNGQTNISVAGGITMNDSLTEFTGCVEEFPIAHNYPYVTCLDQNGGQGDGFGTANTSGTWNFNNDVWRYNYQDGLDLLHSNSQFITVTNSLSYGSLGDQFKLGPGNVTVFNNNYMNANCQRVGFPMGDEPFTPMPSFYNLCRAAGDLIVSENSYGSVTVNNNSMLGYASVAVQIQCGAGFDNCSTNQATFNNNVIVGNATASGYNGGSNTSALCTLNVSLQNDCGGTPSSFPTNQGFTTRANNIYQAMFHCPTTTLASEDCNPGAVGFAYVQTVNSLPFTLAGEELMDPYNIPASYNGTYLTCTNAGWYPSSGGLIATFGTPISGLTLDSCGNAYNVTHPSIGNLQFLSGAVSSPTQLKGVILKGVTIK